MHFSDGKLHPSLLSVGAAISGYIEPTHEKLSSRGFCLQKRYTQPLYFSSSPQFSRFSLTADTLLALVKVHHIHQLWPFWARRYYYKHILQGNRTVVYKYNTDGFCRVFLFHKVGCNFSRKNTITFAIWGLFVFPYRRKVIGISIHYFLLQGQ